jgi:hypothetical protein
VASARPAAGAAGLGAFVACAVVCPEVAGLAYARLVEVPTLCVLAGDDATLPKASALLLAQGLKAAAKPTSLRSYPGQARGFVDGADLPAGAAAVDDLRAWFATHLAPKEDWRVDRLLGLAGKGVPEEADWWPTSSAAGGGEASGKGFVNVGAANWAAARVKWVAATVQRPPKPPLVGYDALVDGFADPRRTFELPGRVSLPNMTAVLNDIWEIEGVS